MTDRTPNPVGENQLAAPSSHGVDVEALPGVSGRWTHSHRKLCCVLRVQCTFHPAQAMEIIG
jgi:hypothetical protein